MSRKGKSLLRFAVLAIFFYFLALSFEQDRTSAAFIAFLGAGVLAELGFWVRLFTPARGNRDGG